MTDYRHDLYTEYVSSLKNCETPRHPLSADFAWPFFDWKYSRHLKYVRNDAPILEVGCGPGDFMVYLTQRGFTNVQGIDVSAEQTKLASGKGLRVECVDVFAYLDRRHETYQAIVALDFVEHFTKEECLRLFRAFCDALRPEGILLIQTPNGQGLFAAQVIHGDLTHCTIFTPRSLMQALRLANFEQIEFTETGPVPKNWKGRARLALWKIIKAGANLIRLVEAGKRQDIWTENFICVCRKTAQGGGPTISKEGQ